MANRDKTTRLCTYKQREYETGDQVCMNGYKYECTNHGWVNLKIDC